MHHFIYSNKSAWISSGSNKISGITETDQNFGKDQILELKKNFYNKSFDYPTRILVQFDLTDLKTKISKGHIPSGSISTDIQPKYFLRLWESEGNSDINDTYTLVAHPISQSWTEGSGKLGDSPKVTDGVSWDLRTNTTNAIPNKWMDNNNTRIYGSSYISHSLSTANGLSPTSGSQTFEYESADINMDVTDIVYHWLGDRIPNNGLLVKFSGSQETDDETFGQLKFFSNNTHTIFQPKLEVKWNEQDTSVSLNGSPGTTCTGTNTGSMLPLSMSGDEDNYVYMKGLRPYYREDEVVRFRAGVRKRYIQKTFSTSVQTVTGSYIPNGSGSYSIIDIATGETMIPFGQYTSMSCDSNSNYFEQHLNGFQPDRTYRILYKLKYDDGQEHIHDENFDFTIRRK